MTRRTLSWALPLFSVIAGAVTLPLGCSEASVPATDCTAGETVACSCANGQTGTETCGVPVCSCDVTPDSGALTTDAGVDAPSEAALDQPGDATHADDKPAPTTTYGMCAQKGSFGWPCTATTSGPDPADCTDPNYPDCFVGGQGAWCTASCAQFGVCPQPVEDGGDAGCVPVACNARGYCK